MLAVDVAPGPPGGESTMTVRTISDQGNLIDTVTLARPTSRPGAPQAKGTAWRRTETGLTVPAQM
jgi:hypothetical protein